MEEKELKKMAAAAVVDYINGKIKYAHKGDPIKAKDVKVLSAYKADRILTILMSCKTDPRMRFQFRIVKGEGELLVYKLYKEFSYIVEENAE